MTKKTVAPKKGMKTTKTEEKNKVELKPLVVKKTVDSKKAVESKKTRVSKKTNNEISETVDIPLSRNEKDEDREIKMVIGKRFRMFRDAIHKAQHELAAELGIYQSTITNIERGKTFPNIKYLQHFFAKYRLNINWLLTDQGDIFVQNYQLNPNASSVMECHVPFDDPLYKKFSDLMNYMQVPEIREVVLARLTEAKVIFKDEIKECFDQIALNSKEIAAN